MDTKTRLIGLVLFLSIFISGCAGGASVPAADAPDANKFIDDVNETILRLGLESGQAAWVSANFITADTEAMNARATQRFIDAVAKFAKDAVRYDKTEVTPEIRRQLNVLKVGLTMVTPSNPKEGEELTKL